MGAMHLLQEVGEVFDRPVSPIMAAPTPMGFRQHWQTWPAGVLNEMAEMSNIVVDTHGNEGSDGNEGGEGLLRTPIANEDNEGNEGGEGEEQDNEGNDGGEGEEKDNDGNEGKEKDNDGPSLSFSLPSLPSSVAKTLCSVIAAVAVTSAKKKTRRATRTTMGHVSIQRQ